MAKKSKILGALSILPMLYMVAFCVLLAWWITFDPSHVQNPRALLVAFYSVVAVHLAALLLMLGLMVYFLLALRSESSTPAEKMFWATTLIVFNFLAYPFFYLFYVRPRLRAAAARPADVT